MSTTRYSEELGSRIYDFLSENYQKIEDIPPTEVFTVVELWSEFILDEIRKAQIVARVDELEYLQKIYDKHKNDEWFRDPIPMRLDKLKKMQEEEK